MFKEYNQSQGQLLPPNLSDMIEKDHIARLINTVVDDMNIALIESTYAQRGQRAYHPKMLLKLLVYGYSMGLTSSRKLSDKCHEDIVFMWLSGRSAPDFRTIADFRKDKLSDVKMVFQNVLTLCIDLGLVRCGTIALDGTKFQANASRNKAIYRKVLNRRKEKLGEQIDQILKDAEELDREEDRLYGETTIARTGKTFSQEEVSRALKKIGKKKASLGKKKAEKQAILSDIKKKEHVMRKDRNSYTSTDKDATVMMMKETYIAPGYNAQLATEHQVVIAYGLYPNRNDTHLLKPMMKKVEEQTGRMPERIIADAGYGNKMNYRYLKKNRICSFIPYNNYEHEQALRNNGLYEPPQNPDRELERYKFQQRVRLKSEEGKAMMKRRREDVEPVFGDMKRNMGFRRFNLRSKRKCETELGLLCIGHNLKKVKSWIKKLAEWDTGNEQGQRFGLILGYLPS